MIPSEVLGKLRPVPEDCSRGAVTVTKPSCEREAAAAHSPGERIPSSLVSRICGFEFDIKLPIHRRKKERSIRSQKMPSARSLALQASLEFKKERYSIRILQQASGYYCREWARRQGKTRKRMPKLAKPLTRQKSNYGFRTRNEIQRAGIHGRSPTGRRHLREQKQHKQR
jgi:hypothetical protein